MLCADDIVRALKVNDALWPVFSPLLVDLCRIKYAGEVHDKEVVLDLLLKLAAADQQWVSSQVSERTDER